MKPIAIFLAEKLENLVATEDWLLINNSADELRRLQAKVERLEAPQHKEPEQEPVAHVCVFPLRGDEFFPQTRIEWKNGRPVAGPLYTTPPQRTWVGLTDEERMELMESTHPNNRWPLLALCEAKLREKNT